MKVKIPAGTRDGERIRLKGQGAPASNTILSGDVYLTIRLLPHPLFNVEADNLLLAYFAASTLGGGAVKWGRRKLKTFNE
ncbi:DnaJ C-terminal domain-containing protein [Arsukibacterium sp. MJ3]|uniref:DnaJ C-terminal domain-containing protein n=1 Tax=Arsukibacterium sp. MJ3 TaxID=1632859 RepID=UPI00069C649A|nr:DnaJ C-terminal domain-containing protein [Arsukibacterium sp. MJ3]